LSNLERLKVPVDYKELVDKVLRLKDENEKLKQLVEDQTKELVSLRSRERNEWRSKVVIA
jgi:hypothetical protein